MDIQRRSKSHRRRTQEAAVIATPYSLLFDGNDDVDCGSHASVLGIEYLTADIYWRCPALADLANSHQYGLLSQYQIGPPKKGWSLIIVMGVVPAATFRFYYTDGAPAERNALISLGNLVEGTWYYFRARRYAADAILASFDTTAGTPQWLAAGLTASTSNLEIATAKRASDQLKGHACYAHIWDADKGALAAVPTSPFPVDADTVARYTFSEGAGPTLGDDKGNSNGAITGATWGTNVPSGWTL